MSVTNLGSFETTRFNISGIGILGSPTVLSAVNSKISVSTNGSISSSPSFTYQVASHNILYRQRQLLLSSEIILLLEYSTSVPTDFVIVCKVNANLCNTVCRVNDWVPNNPSHFQKASSETRKCTLFNRTLITEESNLFLRPLPTQWERIK